MLEKWEPISKEHKILVSKEHNFNTDTILLANFSSPRTNDVCADFGCGCGTIGFIWKIRQNPKKISLLELQEQAFNQALETKNINNFGNVEVINENINNYKSVFNHAQFDLIACNPPYKANGSGIKNSNNNMRIARHDDELSMEQLAKAVAFCLKFGGRFCICQRPERLAEIIAIFHQNGLEAKKLRLVQQRESKKPFLFLLECRRGGNVGLDVLPTLFIEKDGDFSDEMLGIYGDYRTID